MNNDSTLCPPDMLVNPWNYTQRLPAVDDFRAIEFRAIEFRAIEFRAARGIGKSRLAEEWQKRGGHAIRMSSNSSAQITGGDRFWYDLLTWK